MVRFCPPCPSGTHKSRPVFPLLRLTTGRLMKPFFSVLMPLYNHDTYVGDALRSLMEQTFDDFEVVVCNDGSTDGSLDIVDGFKDSRLRVIDKPNGGTVSALNAALMVTRGSYICWLSSDDLFSRDKLRTHYKHHRAHPESMMSATGFGYFKDGQFIRDIQIKPPAECRLMQFAEGNYINGLSVCAHRHLYVSCGNFDARFRYAHDVERWFHFLNHHEISFIEGEPQSFSRLNTSIVQDADLLGMLDVLRLLFTRLQHKGLKGFIPQSFQAAGMNRSQLLMLTIRLFSPSNLFKRFGLMNFVVDHYAKFIGSADLSAMMEQVYQAIATKNDERSKFVLQHLDEVKKRLAGDLSLSFTDSYPEHLAFLKSNINDDELKRILTHYLQHGF